MIGMDDRDSRIKQAEKLVPEILRTGHIVERPDAKSRYGDIYKAEDFAERRFSFSLPGVPEALARVKDTPVIGIIRHDDKSDSYRTREGLGTALRDWYDSETKKFDTKRIRLILPNSSDETVLRAVHGAICDAKGIPDTNFETWKRDKVKIPSKPNQGRTLPDTSAIERNAELQVGQQYE